MIRKFTKADLPRMVEIAKAAWKNIFDGYKEQLDSELYSILFENKFQDKEYQLTNFTEKYPDQCFICMRGEVIAGFATFAFDYDRKVGILLNNAADPALPEKGVGQEMYAAVLEHFKENGMLAASVNTGLDEGHAPARRAYERAGFTDRIDSVTYYKIL